MSEDAYQYEYVAGRPSLDFVNTVGGLRPAHPREYLLDYADLIRWARQAGLIDSRRGQALLAEAARNPQRAEQAVESARRVREALHDLILSALRSRRPPAEALELVNRWIADAMGRRRLIPRGAGYELDCQEEPRDLLAFLVPLALDAAEVLSGELGRVHLCDEAEVGRCGWVFLDETKNHSRRYCTMKDCGNRAKQRRFRRRLSS
jgi:predicted RNA-binding Zn ribbon-like protein